MKKKKKILSMEQQIEPDKTNLSRFQIIWSFWQLSGLGTEKEEESLWAIFRPKRYKKKEEKRRGSHCLGKT